MNNHYNFKDLRRYTDYYELSFKQIPFQKRLEDLRNLRIRYKLKNGVCRVTYEESELIIKADSVKMFVQQHPIFASENLENFTTVSLVNILKAVNEECMWQLYKEDTERLLVQNCGEVLKARKRESQNVSEQQWKIEILYDSILHSIFPKLGPNIGIRSSFNKNMGVSYLFRQKGFPYMMTSYSFYFNPDNSTEFQDVIDTLTEIYEEGGVNHEKVKLRNKIYVPDEEGEAEVSALINHFIAHSDKYHQKWTFDEFLQQLCETYRVSADKEYSPFHYLSFDFSWLINRVYFCKRENKQINEADIAGVQEILDAVWETHERRLTQTSYYVIPADEDASNCRDLTDIEDYICYKGLRFYFTNHLKSTDLYETIQGGKRLAPSIGAFDERCTLSLHCYFK